MPAIQLASHPEDGMQRDEDLASLMDVDDDGGFTRDCAKLMSRVESFQAFYAEVFPHHLYSRWLSSLGDLSHREFAYTMQNGSFFRWASYDSYDGFKENLIKRSPLRIELGATFNVKPKDHKSFHTVNPEERELVFDIDLTDYDELRTCGCDSACTKCWTWMKIAVRVLDQILRDDFGFRHILYVYSGRRGLHIWVCDQRARRWTDEMRAAATKFITVVKGGDQSVKKVSFWNPHSSLTRSLKVCEEYLPQLAREHRMLENEGVRKLLQHHNASKPLDSMVNLASVVKPRNYAEIVLQLAYPRLDANVSIHRNHLLKSPWVIHPGTGRLCVPLSTEMALKFVPESAPTLESLLGRPENRVKTLRPYTDAFKGLISQMQTGSERQLL